ncbi:trafficking protein particle complex subunit 4-like [Lytechinus pictus]|uniref:trafficking protein particle complex subunit 4-like n=1 Tax=Lytechinus pictus TaxID=7653 RepID=UPI0030B9B710
MTVYSVYIINRAGGLIYQLDHANPKTEVEKTFSYPLELTLKIMDERVVVAFGQRDGIHVGHTVLGVNGEQVKGRQLEDGREVLEVIANQENYPIAIRFGRPKLSTNERIMLASMFHSLYAIGSQLSPEQRSSGIQLLETDAFKLYCYQTLSGIKLIVLSDPRQTSMEGLLKKIYELYADYALKNPFYSIDMPVRCELFDLNLQATLDAAERSTFYAAGS